MNICAAGETLLVPYITELTSEFIEEGHIVSLVTNGTVHKVINELCDMPIEKRQKIFMKFSFHYLELKKGKLLDHFFQNVRKIQEADIGFTVELTVNDESIGYIDDIRKVCNEKLGCDCHIIESRQQDGKDWPRLTQLTMKEHQKKWGVFNSELFEFQQTIWGEKRNEFCYAGDWVVSIDLKNGDVCPCFGGGHVIDNIYRFLDRPIQFHAIGKNCPWGHCFAAHALLTHGVIPGFTAPTYAEVRNRCIPEQREWLGSSLKQIFSTRLSDYNQEYNIARKELTNFISGIEYGKYEMSDADKVLPHLLKYFKNNNYKNIAIYGAGRLGRALGELLEKCNLNVVCFLDKNYENINFEKPCVAIESVVESVDVIIISVHRVFYDIKEMLRLNNRADIISIIDLYVDEMNDNCL
ncbi:hypothetical protein acsn021_05290 [Anaerocolumna cellulosilytica]|uniref:Uncharacterized protein n=2 Tax=Anaerocolumna cellulosilytica TaxID=433286 RepID=A0A6S6R0Y4_9FIRM|nr:hypothetical protein acsn021_05290 [Anaerocolumna cellulosilytica]